MPRPGLVEGLCELIPVYTIFDHDIPPYRIYGRVCDQLGRLKIMGPHMKRWWRAVKGAHVR
jgi:hypothetical protein